ncbi:MAG: type II secretion system protein GspC [Thermodesulfobacteriota bacterium]
MVKKIAPVVNFLLLTLAVYLGVGLFYKVVLNRMEAILPAEGSSAREDRPRETAVNRQPGEYSVIAQRNIFKAREKTGGTAGTLDLDNMKRTDLDLRLLGTISGSDRDSFAVIEQVKDRSQKLYRVGDAIDQARIKMIVRKKVVLTIDGRDEVLEIPEERTAATSETGKSTEGKLGDRDNLRASERGDVTSVTLNRADVEKSFNNVNELMRSVRVRPHFSDGKPDGLRLDNVTSGSIFKDMGLQDKDIIVGVNSRRINTVDDCMEVYRNLSSASELMLEIKRGERSRFIKYTIR